MGIKEQGKFLFTPQAIEQRVNYLLRKTVVTRGSTERSFNGRPYSGETSQAVLNGNLLAERISYTIPPSDGASEEPPDERSEKDSLRPFATYGLYGTMNRGPVSVKVTVYEGDNGGLAHSYHFELPEPNLPYGATRMVVVRNPEESPFTEEEQRNIAATLGIGLQ